MNALEENDGEENCLTPEGEKEQEEDKKEAERQQKQKQKLMIEKVVGIAERFLRMCEE